MKVQEWQWVVILRQTWLSRRNHHRLLRQGDFRCTRGTGTCWLHRKLLGYCRGGGAGVPDPIGRVHTGNPTKGRGSFPKGGRVGERDLSIITMMATGKNSSI